ncbi:MAG: alpha/beta hydrolase family protein [Candidatus Limivicinus sp.]|jgi:dienelactone hydrolase
MKNREGSCLRGIVTMPESEGRFPAVLLLHGFAGSVSGYKYLNTRIARSLAERGIACARFDFYGCGESDGEFEELSFSGLCRDAEDMFSWLKEQDFADTGRLCLAGQSLGGYVAASTAPFLRPAALLLLCPGGGMWYGAKPNADAVTASGADFADLEGLCFKMSFNYDMASHPEPFMEAQGYGGRVFIARARNDKLVGERAFMAYAACYDKPVLLQTEGGGHNFASIPAREKICSAMAEFINSL